MDGLSGYGSDSDTSSSGPSDPSYRQQRPVNSASNPQQYSRSTHANDADTAEPMQGIGLPSAADLLIGGVHDTPHFPSRGTGAAAQSIGPGDKRPHPGSGPAGTQQGSVQGGATKTARTAPQGVPQSAGRGQQHALRPQQQAGRGGNHMLPPQLRGRANVSTEDLASMFTKRALQGRQRGAGTD